MSRVRNDEDLLLRVRQDKKIRVKYGTDLLLRVKRDKKSIIKNDAGLRQV